jgi:hypothetical protein
MHTDMKSLINTLMDTDIEDSQGMAKLKDLFDVYQSALNYPPQGVIGVGTITYAEQMLVAYQSNKESTK